MEARAAPVFAALGDASRLAILARLCAGGPLPTAALDVGATRQGVTKHLRVLEQAGLVESFRAGRDRCWQVRGERLEEARRALEQASAEWDARLERLKALVER